MRIKTTPREREIDGIRLDQMEPGSVREVSSSIGSWLIAQGYAEPEMRHPHEPELFDDPFQLYRRPKDRRGRRPD